MSAEADLREGLCLEEGRGVRVVSCVAGDAAGKRFRLEAEALAALLARRGVAERRAVVVSVAGAFRGGKSFLLDFMLRYLYAQAGAREAPDGDWLGGEREPLRGFSWRNGTGRETIGLELWSQPIPLTLPCGEEVVVLLMDTQGAFDEQSSLRDSSLVFALSTLLASVQVYNVSRRLDECDLQHLQLFTDYAGMGGGALQDLQVLVRDWSAPYEYAYGANGGNAYLNHKLQIKEEHPRESREVREGLMSSFERVDCFLLPHPGLNAANDPHFRGELADLTEEFKQSLRELVEWLLAPSRLRVKVVEGQALRAGELAVFLQAYLAEFCDRVPSPLTALAATAKARWAVAAGSARAALSGPPASRALPRATLRAHLDAARRAALQPLAPLAERADETAALAQLEEELERLVEQQIESNARSVELASARARGLWEHEARARLADARLCVHPRDLPPLLRATLHAARGRFEEDVESHEDDPELADLLQELEECYVDVLSRLEPLNDARNTAGVANARAVAASALAPAPCVPAAALAAQHAAARAAAAAAFRDARSAPTTHADDPYLTQLENLIAEDQRKHASENEANQNSAVAAALEQYTQSLADQALDLAAGCWLPQRLAAAHEQAARRARDHFTARRGGHTEDEFTRILDTGLSERHRVIHETNVIKNEEAVDEGYQKFCETMDSSCGFLQLEADTFQEYLGNAVRAGRREFYRLRAAGNRQAEGEDAYRDQLNQRMLARFEYYAEQNSEKVTKEELVKMAMLLGVVVLVVGTGGACAAIAAGSTSTGAAASGAAASVAGELGAASVASAAIGAVSTLATVYAKSRQNL